MQEWAQLMAPHDLVSFRMTLIFERDGAVLSSDSTPRFQSRRELADSLAAASLTVEEVCGAPGRAHLTASSVH